MDNITKQQMDDLLLCLSRLSRGDSSGDCAPSGFEALSMSLGGEGIPGKNGSIRESLDSIAFALNGGNDQLTIAGGLYDIADAIRYLADTAVSSAKPE